MGRRGERGNSLFIEEEKDNRVLFTKNKQILPLQSELLALITI